MITISGAFCRWCLFGVTMRRNLSCVQSNRIVERLRTAGQEKGATPAALLLHVFGLLMNKLRFNQTEVTILPFV